MHLEKIEEYNFEHGLHFDVVTGEYSSLNPHTLGRPLTHEEMDYNLLYQKQTVNGYRIAGSNNDLTLSADDLGKVLSFVQISNTDTDWSRWSDAGLLDGQFIWAPVEMYTTTQATTIATTAATTAQTQPTTIATQATTIATAATTAATQATTIATAATTAATQATTEATQATTQATAATTIATLFTMTVTPTVITENSPTESFEYKVVTSPAVPAGTTVQYTISGPWQGPANNEGGVGDIQVIGVNLGGGGGVSEPVPFPESPESPYVNNFIFDANGEAAIKVYGTNDQSWNEVQEAVIVTLAPNDSDGRATGSISITGGINPATTIATTLATQATTLATQPTTLATQATTLPPVLGYYFHGGNQSYPFAQSADGLTAANPGTMYYDDGSNAFASTTDLSVAMSYIMDNMGTTYSPGNYTLSSFNIPSGGIPALGSSDALNFGAMNDGGGEFYYIILPDGNVDLTSTNPQHLVDGGISTNAVQKASFTWNSDTYWLYRLGGGSQTGARTITFSDND